MRLTCILAVLIAVTFHATANALPADAGKVIHENGADTRIPTHVHDQRLLRRVRNDEGELTEERTGGLLDKIKSVVKKITPEKAVTKFKEKDITNPEWLKIIKHKVREAKGQGYK
ncbi:avr2 family secreted RxLR effector peptide protein, putative [Phytophthora infestans T30-4]|uniref:RxLR effector protein n=3 Tax=Phytophthora infestans TaxID=4787 RepID=D0NN49_PHYIT|nr:avr2 family secreted RxLR effector peptide protein, putative [Phytophthora infestans T30-4]EEY61956.1 avr2 family secreted RxLR effector peptide protein, putative [Phytophthora infestans T30-4]KAF4037487.1 hypothetical protein GN244_ATG10221 [Phytophthora infestans]KAF4140134.1 hypothetical protein GN958_ATG10673 [Phytophthora infestans]|eukprot:XP_002899596.1 avr2 family secreted RxLR effector peptide protein, putative [Phytophthora infestans T30-4]